MSYTDFVIHGHKGIELQARTWNVPQGTPVKAKIVFIHGFSEHKDCYDTWFTKVAAAGYQVTMFDQRGFGKTPKNKKDEGVTTDALQMADIEKVVTYVSKDYDGPLYLWGHSMGGGLTLTYAHRGEKRQRFDGYLANSPYIQGSPDGPNGSFLAKLLPLAYRIAPNRRETVKIGPEMCTNDSSRWEEYKKDPLRPNIGTTSVFYEMMKRGKDLLDESIVGKIVNKPILLSQGTKDVLCDVEGAKKFAELAKKAKKDITLELYEDKPHELMQLVPADQQKHLEDVLQWLDAHVAALKAPTKTDDKAAAPAAAPTTTAAPVAAAATTAAPTATKATEPIAETKTAAPVEPVEPAAAAAPATTSAAAAAAAPVEAPKAEPAAAPAIAKPVETAAPKAAEPLVEAPKAAAVPVAAEETPEPESASETPEQTPEPESAGSAVAGAKTASKKSKKKKGKKGKN